MADEGFHRTWLTSDRAIPKRFLRPVLRFTRVEAAGGIVLLVAAAAALAWANAPFGESYHEFWQTRFEVSLGPLHLEETLRGLVNDGLMALFFFVVGLEIKRELVMGELRDRRTAALPLLAAVGGMVVPALIYLGFAGGGAATRGWAVPVATDIAFSLGVVSLLGKRVPVGAKLFLLTLAVADDVGGILVIAVYYTESLALGWLAGAVAGLAVVWLANRACIRSTPFYTLVAFTTWLCLLESGVHATIAGVALGLLTPTRSLYSDHEYQKRARRILGPLDPDPASPEGRERIDEEALTLATVARESVAPLDRLERTLHPWSSFLVIPAFALANAGVRLAGIDLFDAATHPVALGVALGLVVGKTAGISAFAWLALRLGLGRLPRLMTWRHLAGISMLAGIGFTVSLFIAGLAFSDPGLGDRAKIGIFAGSALAGIAGYLWLRFGPPPTAASGEPAPESGPR